MNLPHRDLMLYRAGQERGIAIIYLARAKGATNGSRATLVRLAREAGHESIRYLKASREQGR
jgi:hypothetical protein